MAMIDPAPLRKPEHAKPTAANDTRPADPVSILSSPPPSPRGRSFMFRGVLLLVGGLLVGELALPTMLKPSVIAGDAVARYHFRTMTMVNQKEIELQEQITIAQKGAEIEAQRAQLQSLCALTVLLDPEIAQQCAALVNYTQDAAATSIEHSKRQGQ